MEMNNFTPRAQQVLALARKEADRFNHNYVGTEHLLLGLIKLGQGVAVNVLQKMGLDLETVRMEVEKQIGTGPETKMVGNIPYTPAREEGSRARPEGSQAAQSQLRGHRTHSARIASGRRRSRGAHPEIARCRYRTLPQRDFEGTRPELHAERRRSRRRRSHRQQEGNEDARAADVRARPHGVGAQGRPRPGGGPPERNRARDPDSLPPHQEQPRASRRSWCRQDRHRGRVGPGSLQGQCTRDFARQTGRDPRPSVDGGGHQVSRPV